MPKKKKNLKPYTTEIRYKITKEITEEKVRTIKWDAENEGERTGKVVVQAGNRIEQGTIKLTLQSHKGDPYDYRWEATLILTRNREHFQLVRNSHGKEIASSSRWETMADWSADTIAAAVNRNPTSHHIFVSTKTLLDEWGYITLMSRVKEKNVRLSAHLEECNT